MEWAYVNSTGLKIDYFGYYKLPKSKRKKIVDVAKIIDEHQLERAATFSSLSVFKNIFQ